MYSKAFKICVSGDSGPIAPSRRVPNIFACTTKRDGHRVARQSQGPRGAFTLGPYASSRPRPTAPCRLGAPYSPGLPAVLRLLPFPSPLPLCRLPSANLDKSGLPYIADQTCSPVRRRAALCGIGMNWYERLIDLPGGVVSDEGIVAWCLWQRGRREWIAYNWNAACLDVACVLRGCRRALDACGLRVFPE